MNFSIWFLKSKYRHNNFTYSISRYLIGIYQMVILFFIFIWTWNGIVRYFPLISSPLCICGLPLQTQWAALLMAPLYIWDPCFSHSMTPVSWIVKNEHGILEKNKINGGNFLLVKLFIIPIMKFIIIPPRIIVLFSYVSSISITSILAINPYCAWHQTELFFLEISILLR